MDNLRLPVELISEILHLLDRGGFLALRGTNKVFHALATPRAFQELPATDTVSSAQGLLGLQSSLEITDCVKSVVFRSSTPGPEFSQDSTQPEDEAKLAVLFSAFEGLSKFPQLASLRFEFHDEFVEEDYGSDTVDPSYFLRMQRAILDGASSAPLPMLESLTLMNLIAVPHPLYESPMFAEFLQPIEILSIYVIQDELSEGSYASENLAEFWGQMTAILSAAQSVASLSLRSSAIIGITPALTLPTTPLPNLTSLFLEGICFSSEDCPGCPESFVLMHAAHLAHLTLVDCPLYGHERVWPRSRAAVLANFRAQLSALLSVSIHGDTCLFYTYEDMGWGLITLDADEFSLDGSIDRLALEELVATLEARNLVKEE